MTNCLKVVVLLAVAAATTANGQVHETSRREPSFGIYAAEAGGGIIGALGLGGTFAVATVFWPFYIDNPPETNPGVLLGIAGTLGLVGCAGGTWLAGSGFNQHGKFLPTIAYATATSAVGLGLCLVGTQLRNHYSPVRFAVGEGMRYTGVGLFFATPFAAAYGYNRSRPRDSYGSRFVPGSVSLASVRDGEGIAHPSVNVRLLSVRF